MTTKEELMKFAEARIKGNILEEGVEQSKFTLRAICRKRGGKFKLSEKQFVDELTTMWVAGSLCAAERALRLAEYDDTHTLDDVKAELHMLVHDIYKILKPRLGLTTDVGLEDLIYGKYSTENAMKEVRTL